MSSQQGAAKLSDDESQSKPLVNYDPARFVQCEDYRLTKFSICFSNGERAQSLIIPAADLNSQILTPEERYAASMRVRSLYFFANRIIDPEKLANPQGVDGIATTVAISAATIIFVNILEIFGAKWDASDYPPAIAIPSGDGVIHSVKDFSAPADLAIVAEKLRPILVDEIKSDLSASWFVWRHIFFSILYAIERDYGSLNALSGDDRERLFEEYKETEFSEAFHRAIYFCSQSYVAEYLESLNPSQWSIESLMGFLGYEPADGEDVNAESVRMSPAQIHKLIENLQRDSNDLAEVAYSLIDGKASLTINLPMVADMSDFIKAIEASVKSQRKPRISEAQFLGEGLRAATALAKRAAIKNLTVENLAKEMGRDREAVGNWIEYYQKAAAQIFQRFADVRAMMKR